MERLSHNYHAKLQEMCDCFMDTNYPVEMSRPLDIQSANLEEEGMRYFALLILYTLTVKARQLSLKRKEGKVKVSVDIGQEKKTLPPPPEPIVAKIVEIVRAITDIEDDHGETDFSLGLRGTQVELRIKVKRKEGGESVKLVFPEL